MTIECLFSTMNGEICHLIIQPELLELVCYLRGIRKGTGYCDSIWTRHANRSLQQKVEAYCILKLFIVSYCVLFCWFALLCNKRYVGGIAFNVNNNTHKGEFQ